MSEFAIPEDQQIRQAYFEIVAQSNVTKQRNLQLEKRNTETQAKIIELQTEKRDVTEHFNGYQKQTKEEKEKSDTKQMELEHKVKELETQCEDTQTKFEHEIRTIQESNELQLRDLNNKIFDLDSRSAEVDNYLGQKR